MEAIAERPTQMLQTRQSFVDIYEMLRRVEEHRKLDVETRLKMLASLPPIDDEIECLDELSWLERDEEEDQMKASVERPMQKPQIFVEMEEMLRRVEEHRKLDVETRLKMLASLPPLDEEILCFDDTRALARDREARIMALLDM